MKKPTKKEERILGLFTLALIAAFFGPPLVFTVFDVPEHYVDRIGAWLALPSIVWLALVIGWLVRRTLGREERER